MDPALFTEYDITPAEIATGKSDRQDIIVIIRGHPMSGQNQEGWGIPLQSLIPKDLEGIIVTGKPACRKIHYIASCAKVGEAAGVVAAVAALNHVPVRNVNVETVRKYLKMAGWSGL